MNSVNVRVVPSNLRFVELRGANPTVTLALIVVDTLSYLQLVNHRPRQRYVFLCDATARDIHNVWHYLCLCLLEQVTKQDGPPHQNLIDMLDVTCKVWKTVFTRKFGWWGAPTSFTLFFETNAVLAKPPHIEHQVEVIRNHYLLATSPSVEDCPDPAAFAVEAIGVSPWHAIELHADPLHEQQQAPNVVFNINNSNININNSNINIQSPLIIDQHFGQAANNASSGSPASGQQAHALCSPRILLRSGQQGDDDPSSARILLPSGQQAHAPSPLSSGSRSPFGSSQMTYSDPVQVHVSSRGSASLVIKL